jgi:geranylgeranyl pyrophosphate synthase
MALAFQAAAFRTVEQSDVNPVCKGAILSSLASLALGTAAGQYLDTQNLMGEDNYWQIVRAKSTPFYGTALYVGALLGRPQPNQAHSWSATLDVAEALHQLGALFGEMIQIHDDLMDTFQIPASPDWTQGRLSLPILYAKTADHADRDLFLDLLPRVDEPQLLQQAQEILIRCGAVSYCAYQLVQRHRLAYRMLEDIDLVDREPMISLWRGQLQPLIRLLSENRHALSGQVDIPAELLEFLK